MAKQDKKASKSSPKASAAPIVSNTVSSAEVTVPVETETVYEGAEGTKSGAQLGQLVKIRLSELDAESFENQRTGDFTDSGDSNEDGSDQSFAEIVASIEKVGQKDPVTARYKLGVKAGSGVPALELIKGFRRYAAIRLIGQKRGDENPEINVIIKELTDLEALEENVFENTSRANLSGPDLAWAAWKLEQKYKAEGIAVSDNLLAKRMGKNQSYISKIKKIVVNAPEVARAWRETKAPLAVDVMKRISELPREEQQQEYQRINAAMGGKGNARSAPKPPFDTAKLQVTKLARLLGALAGQGLITVDINWEANLSHIGVKTKDLTVQDLRAVAKVGRDEFAKAAAEKSARGAESAAEEATAEPAN